MNNTLIGEVAGRIWQQLGTKGQTSLPLLSKNIRSNAALTQLAVGWLAREGKVNVAEKGSQIVVSLTDEEARHFETQHQNR
jgi:hypothetical protein